MKNPKHTKIIVKIPKIILLQKRNLYREVYRRPPMCQIWRIYLDLWGYDCKKSVWPIFGCKLGQSDPIVMQFKLDMLCHLLNVYTKFQIDISKHVEEKSGKRGRTDGQTLPWLNKNSKSNWILQNKHRNPIINRGHAPTKVDSCTNYEQLNIKDCRGVKRVGRMDGHTDVCIA